MAWMAAINAGAGLITNLATGGAKRAAAREQAFSQYEAAFRAETNQRAQAIFQNTFQNLMISAANQRTKEIFGKQLEFYESSKFYRSEAADLAFQSNERKLKEIFTAAKFGRLRDEQALAASLGSWAAADEGNRGRSFSLASQKENLAKFGIASSELTESLHSAMISTKAADENVRRELRSAEFQAYQEIAVPPALQMQLPEPQFAPDAQLQLPKFNTGLSIASAVVGAGQTFLGGLDPDTVKGIDKGISSFFGLGKKA